MSATQPVSMPVAEMTERERELGAIIAAYNDVTEQLKQSHERLRAEVTRLHEELARKNQQLRRRERLAALGEMAAGLAHEIRNPLGGIQMFASMLEQDVSDRSPALRLVRKISQGVATVESIVTDILQFGRPRDPVGEVVDLRALIRETIELAVDPTGERRVRVDLDEHFADVTIVSDQAMIKRAVLNLLLNAVDAARAAASDDGPRVIIGVREHGSDHVLITVTDNGPGVPAELMDRIFNPFFTTKDRGTGLGLAIVHQIAEALGGHVQVSNRDAGGAVFSICLPRRLKVTEN